MDLKELGSTILSNAPTIGAVLGSVVPGLGTATGGLAGTAVKAIARVFGLGDTATADQIAQAVQADPQAALKLKLAEMDYQNQEREREMRERESVREREFQEFKTRLLDVQSARQREVEIVKTMGRRDMLQFWLAWFGWAAPVGMVIYLLVRGLPQGMSPEAAAMIGTFIGIIIGEYKTIYQYFFGSSKSSEIKTEMLSKAPPIL